MYIVVVLIVALIALQVRIKVLEINMLKMEKGEKISRREETLEN